MVHAYSKIGEDFGFKPLHSQMCPHAVHARRGPAYTESALGATEHLAG